MVEFVYHNFKNVSTSYILFKLNYDYHLHILYKKDIDSHYKLKLINKLLIEL